MSPTSCCRTDFLLGFLHHLAHASDRAGLELLGLSIGDQSPFDKHLGHRPSGRSEQRPYHQCTGTDPKAGNQIAAAHDIVKSGQSPHSVAYTAGFNQFDRFVSIGPSVALIFGRVRRRCRRPLRDRAPRIARRTRHISAQTRYRGNACKPGLSSTRQPQRWPQQILPLLLEDISSSNCHDVR